MKRYDEVSVVRMGTACNELTEHPGGDWCKWEDVRAEIERLQKQQLEIAEAIFTNFESGGFHWAARILVQVHGIDTIDLRLRAMQESLASQSSAGEPNGNSTK